MGQISARCAAGGLAPPDDAHLSAIFRRSTDAVVLCGADGLVHWTSPAADALFELEPGELAGQAASLLAHPDDRASLPSKLDALNGCGDSTTVEFRHVDRHGHVRWIEDTVTDLMDDPSIGWFVHRLSDVTSQREVREQVDLQLRLLGAVGQAVVAMSPDQTTIYWNEAASRLYGWTEAEAVGRPISELLRPADGWEVEARELFDDVSAGGTWSGEFWVKRKDGTPIPVLATDTPVYGGSGELLAWIGVSSDLTERISHEQAQAQLSAIVTASGDAIFSVSLDGDVMTWNAGAAELFGHRAEDIVGQPIARIVPPDRRVEIDEILDSIRSGESIRDLETVRLRADGSEVDVSLSIAPIRDASGAIVGIASISRNVSDRVALLDRLERDGEHLRDAQRLAQLGSFEVDLESGARSWSDELYRILGVPTTQTPTTESWVELTHPKDKAQMASFQRGLLLGEERSCRLRIVRPDQSVRSIAIQCLPRAEGATVMSGTVLDVTDQMLAEDRLAYRALHDPLTDLANRVLLSERLDQALLAQVRTGHPVGVAFVDLDQFKMVNDSLGHTIGDLVLIAVANRLRGAASEADTVGRFGGDEFIVVRPECADLPALKVFAEKLRTSLEAPIVVDDREFFLSASVGATLSQPMDTTTSMQRDADTAMYYAKQRGRNRSNIFDAELRLRTQDRLALTTELRAALSRDQFRLVYQPIVTLDSHTIVGYEVLLRWDHPERGAIAPVDFIPLAEESGLIVPIGHWVLGEAIAQLATWRAASTSCDELWISINLSVKQLEQPGIIDMIQTAIEDSGLPPHVVHFEITESVLMSNIEHSISTVNALHELGVRISVDDFGTGYSSLSSLKQLPVDTLKIDKSFVSGLGHDLEDRSIAQAIVALADALGLQVLAEGIETSTQAATLVDIGCDLGQGFLWSPAVSPEQAVHMRDLARLHQ